MPKVQLPVRATEAVAHDEGLFAARVHAQREAAHVVVENEVGLGLGLCICDRAFRELCHCAGPSFRGTTLAPPEREFRRKSWYRRKMHARENIVKSVSYRNGAQAIALGRNGLGYLIT